MGDLEKAGQILWITTYGRVSLSIRFSSFEFCARTRPSGGSHPRGRLLQPPLGWFESNDGGFQSLASSSCPSNFPWHLGQILWTTTCRYPQDFRPSDTDVRFDFTALLSPARAVPHPHTPGAQTPCELKLSRARGRPGEGGPNLMDYDIWTCVVIHKIFEF